jgi:diguanylate cyclase (GGDEF)-like protein/PAS domain S-box-containing protein
MRKIAKGDFSIKVHQISDNNEIGEMAGAIEVFRNNSAQRLAVETRIRSVLETALDGIIVTNKMGIITGFNSAAEKIFGYSEGFLKGKNVSILIPEPHKSKHDSYIENYHHGKPRRVVGEIVQQQAVRSNGEQFPIELSLNEMKIEGEVYFTGMIRDITDRVKSEEKIKRMALTDSLTELSNRHHFDKKFEEAVSNANRTKNSFGLLLIDMDKFKPVNDTYGHSVGDALLVEVAKRLKAEKRDTDTVARIGGDEFAIILNHLENSESVNVPLKRISHVLSQAYIIDGHELDVGASIGVSIFPEQSKDIDELFKIADAAMYANKPKPSR